MISSDSQAMGRIGEVVTRCWQTAHKMKVQRGPLPGDSAAQRQRACQALRGQVHDQPGHHARHRARDRLDRAGQAGRSGAVEAGLLWRQAGAGGQGRLDRLGGMGDANASIPTPQPVLYRPMFGSFGRAIGPSGITFMSQAALDDGIPEQLGLTKQVVAVRNCRTIGKARWCTTMPRRTSRWTRRRTRCASTAYSPPASRPPCCPWRSGISCSSRRRHRRSRGTRSGGESLAVKASVVSPDLVPLRFALLPPTLLLCVYSIEISNLYTFFHWIFVSTCNYVRETVQYA